MAIQTDSLRRFIYEVSGTLKSDRVAAILKSIEQYSRIVEDRVALKPEFVTSKVSCPIEFSLPPEIVPVPTTIDRIVDHNPGTWPNPFPEALRELSRIGLISVTVKFSKFGHSFCCRIEEERNAAAIVIELLNVQGLESAARIEALKKLSELLGLPVVFPSSSAPPA